MTIAAGAAVSVAALLLAFAIAPLAARWSAREAVIEARVETLARLRALVRDEATLKSVLLQRESGGAISPLVSGRTAALAGSALQTTIQEYAAGSRVTISRLDLAGPADSAKYSLPVIPASVSAVGDVYGVTEFLSRLQYGSPVVEIRQLTLVSNSALRDGLLQLSVSLRAPAVIDR